MLTDVNFPKWAMARMEGPEITKDEALEIIRRSDIFFQSLIKRGQTGYTKTLSKRLGIKYKLEEGSIEELEELEKWKKEWGVLGLRFLHTDWISSSYYKGANGWCNPWGGKIDKVWNIGRYPTEELVMKDLEKIGKTFPFLTGLSLTIYDREMASWKKAVPLVRYQVGEGGVITPEYLPLIKEKLVVKEEVRVGSNYFEIDQLVGLWS